MASPATPPGCVRDEDGNVRTVEEMREMEEEEEALYQSIKASVAERNDALRAANPVAHAIPPALYEKAAADPGSLTADERNLILSRGDPESRALADPSDTTLAERYNILGWPAPEVVEQRIRAATRKAGGPELSTPAELFAKAERVGIAALSPDELQLVTHQFHLENPGEGDYRGPSMFCRVAVPGNAHAYQAIANQQGVRLEVVASALMQNIQKNRDELARRYPQLATLQQPAQPMGQPIGQQPMGMPSRTPAEMTGSGGGGDPALLPMHPALIGQGGRGGFGSTVPGGVGPAGPDGVPPSQRLPQLSAPSTSSAPTIPDPQQEMLGRILAEFAESMENIKKRHTEGRMSTQDFHDSYDDSVRTLRHFALRFDVTPLPPYPPAYRPSPPHIQAWADKEEQARRDHQGGQLQWQEPPHFYNTPPYWPFLATPRTPFDIYLESVRGSEAARTWPKGDFGYARDQWEAMAESEQAVYMQKRENRRRQAWVDAFEQAQHPYGK